MPRKANPAIAIEALRERLGYNQADFCRLLGVDPVSWRRWNTIKGSSAQKKPAWIDVLERSLSYIADEKGLDAARRVLEGRP